MERPLSGCGWWINDEQKDHHMEFSGFLKSILRVDKSVCILIGNNVLNASPYDGEKLKLRSVKDKHSQCSETMPSSLIIYSCLRRWKLWFPELAATNRTRSDALFYFLQVRTMLRSIRELHALFSGTSFSSLAVLSCPWQNQTVAGWDFEWFRSTLMFFRKLETGFSFCLIIIGILHSTSVGIHHGFLPVRCEKRWILTCSLKIYLQYFFLFFCNRVGALNKRNGSSPRPPWFIPSWEHGHAFLFRH